MVVGEASEEREIHKPRHFQAGLNSVFALSPPCMLWFGQPGHWFELAQAEEAGSLLHPSFCCRVCERLQEQNSFPSLSSQTSAAEVGEKHLSNMK